MTPEALDFNNRTIRATADLLAGLLDRPSVIIDTFIAKGFPAEHGFTAELMTREIPLVDADYAALTPALIPTNDERVPYPNIELLGFFRILRFINAALNADPVAVALIRKLAINPRAFT
jgi:hypothetical protein